MALTDVFLLCVIRLALASESSGDPSNGQSTSATVVVMIVVLLILLALGGAAYYFVFREQAKYSYLWTNRLEFSGVGSEPGAEAVTSAPAPLVSNRLPVVALRVGGDCEL